MFNCMLLIYLLILLNLFPINRSVSITLHNRRTIEEGNYDVALVLTLHFDDSEDVHNHSSMLEKSLLCVLINGFLCDCQDENMDLYLRSYCLQSTWQHFRFSILVANDKNPIATLPIVLKMSNSTQSLTPMHAHENPFKISFVLPLTLDDISRYLILAKSLRNIGSDVVQEMLIYVPDNQYGVLQPIIEAASSQLSFPCKIINEQALFEDCYNIKSSTYSYGVQMAIKLLASKYVTTDFYMTLDADIVLLQPFNLSQIINHQGKAIYENEARSVHQHWWEGSERFLQVPLSVNRTEKDSSGFGVTPALLSTYGSLLTLGRIQQLYGLGREASVNSHGFLASSNQHCKGSYLDTWIDGFGHDGIIWSEYTLYRVALDYYQIFNHLHVEQNSNELLPRNLLLHCQDVWFSDSALSWDPLAALHSGCLFSVVQSTAQINPSKILKILQQAGIIS